MQTGQVKQAEALIAQWLAEGQRQAKALPPDVAARLQAAVGLAQGQADNIGIHWPDDRWARPLGDAALAIASCPREENSGDAIADNFMSQWSYHDWTNLPVNEYCRVLETAARKLQDQSDKLSPHEIGLLVKWASLKDSPVEAEQWKKIAVALRRRWDAEPNREVKNELGPTVASVLSQHVGAGEWIAFLRAEIQAAPDDGKGEYLYPLFEAILGQPWSDAYESEGLSLLDRFATGGEPAESLVSQVQSLYLLTDSMIRVRFAARIKAVQHPERLSRTQCRAIRRESLRLAREGLADHLRRAAAKAAPRLAAWMQVEATYLDVRAERNLDKAADECWEQLGPPPEADSAKGRDGLHSPREDRTVERQLEDIRRDRCLITLIRLAARNAKAGLSGRVLAYLENCQAAEPDELRWKRLQYQLLVALDRPRDLEKKLRQWIGAGDPTSAWQVTLGRLLAEQGRLAEAIKLFEAVRAADELSGPDYRALAAWRTAVNQREAAERAAVAAFAADDENTLANWLQAQFGSWDHDAPDNGDAPRRELDADVPRAFVALLEKSSDPQQHLELLRQFYQATHDFRLLAALADAMIGHTAGEVYPFLAELHPLLEEAEDEAAVDSIVQRIAEVRRRTETEIDRRALDLLELAVECRAAELKDQPGPHAERALAAFRRTRRRQWSPGEPRLMSDLLASLGALHESRLAAEQVGEMESLDRGLPRGSTDRLPVAASLAEIHWSYDHYDAAIDLLAAALQEREEACGGGTARRRQRTAFQADRARRRRKHWARGESILRGQLARPANRQQAKWLAQQLHQLYEEALKQNGEVSLGRGETLYRALEQRLRAELDASDLDVVDELVGRLCGIYRTAHRQGYAAAADDVRRFAAEQVPKLLARRLVNRRILFLAADALHNVAGPRDGLLFLIQQIENEPASLQYTGEDAWSRCGEWQAIWRVEAKDLGLDERLLRITLAGLRRNLQSRSRNVHPYCHNGSNAFWKEKEPHFAAVAEAVLAENKDSEAFVLYIARFMKDNLGRWERGVNILLDAQRRGLLHEAGQLQLAAELRRFPPQRYGDLIPIFEIVRLAPAGQSAICRFVDGGVPQRRPERTGARLVAEDGRPPSRQRRLARKRNRRARRDLPGVQTLRAGDRLFPRGDRSLSAERVGSGRPESNGVRRRPGRKGIARILCIAGPSLRGIGKDSRSRGRGGKRHSP